MQNQNFLLEFSSNQQAVTSPLKQFKLLLWINKIIKYPFTSEIEFHRDMPLLISQISTEFANHQSQLQVSLLQCNLGSSHKKCKGLSIVKVQLKQTEDENADSIQKSQQINQKISASIPSGIDGCELNIITQKHQIKSEDSMRSIITQQKIQQNYQGSSLDNLINYNNMSLYSNGLTGATSFSFNQDMISESEKISDILSKLLPDRVFKCHNMDCGKTFKLKQHLKHHLDSHINMNRYVCDKDKCQKSFSRASRLELHIKAAHSGQNLFECEIDGCGKQFAEKGNLLVHMRTHTGEKPYHCRHCEKKFTTIGNCRDHERRHTKDKPYKCKLCPIKYYRRYQLLRHLESKHPFSQTSELDYEDIDEEIEFGESEQSLSQNLYQFTEVSGQPNKRNQKIQIKQQCSKTNQSTLYQQEKLQQTQNYLNNFNEDSQLQSSPSPCVVSASEVKLSFQKDIENNQSYLPQPRNAYNENFQLNNFSQSPSKRQRIDNKANLVPTFQPVNYRQEFLTKSHISSQSLNFVFEKNTGNPVEDEVGFSPKLQQIALSFNSYRNNQVSPTKPEEVFNEFNNYQENSSEKYLYASRKSTSFDTYHDSLQTSCRLSPEEREGSMKFNFDEDFINSQSLDFESLEFETSQYFNNFSCI
eukprot:403347410